MSSVCPAGHRSSADDYCDTCGLPIGEQSGDRDEPDQQAEPQADKEQEAGPVDPVVPVAPVETPDATCPHCQAVNPPDALFCEACGYDFTTGSLPRPVESVEEQGAPVELAGTPAAVEPRQVGQPVDPVEPRQVVEPVETPAPLAPAIAPGWVAEIWIDPDWYADQESADPLPSAGLPAVVPLRSRSLLVGRASQSRGIRPDIDLSSDSGISRRHCQLTTDGTRWWVEDLGSSNGTYVADATAPLPTTPLVRGQRRELDGDDRIYLGAWTRLVVRRAEPGEV